MKQKFRLFAIHQIVTNLQWTDNLNPRTKWYTALDESNRMKSPYFTIHPGKNPPLQSGCQLKSIFFKHQFHILHFPNSTGLFTKPTGRHYTKHRFSLGIARAKSRDHKIVGAQKRVSKGRPKSPPKNHIVWSRILKCSVKSCVTGSSTKCYFNEFLFMQVLNMMEWNKNNGRECLECHGLPVLSSAYLQEVVFEKKSKWPWNMIHLMPCRNPCRLYIHFAFTYSIGPSSVVWSELGPALPFPLMRVLKSVIATGSHSRVWSGLKFFRQEERLPMLEQAWIMLLLHFQDGLNLYVIPKRALQSWRSWQLLSSFEGEHLERVWGSRLAPISPKVKLLGFHMVG